MDSVDLDLLRYCTERENWEDVKDEITKSMTIKESWTLFGDISEYYNEFDVDKVEPRDFKTWFRIKRHPEYKRDKHELFSTIIDNVFETEMPVGDVFQESIGQIKANIRLQELTDEYQKGLLSLSEFQEKVQSINPRRDVNEARSGSDSIDIMELASHARHGGLYWRVEDLNISVGRIKIGDFIIVAKRPEVGGTSFLCSEITFMLEQLPPGGKAVIFNNEEEPHKVKSRLVSTALGTNHIDIMTNPAKWQKEYTIWLGDRELKMIHDTQTSISSIRKRLREEQPDVAGVNVLLKVKGTGKKEDHDKFQELGERFREMAQEFCPIIGIVQADPSAEGMRYIPQDRIYKSKTALQGEADVLIMLGTDEDVHDDRRFLYVAKNKIPPSDTTQTKNKHIKSEVKFDIDTGRFESVNFKKHSRSKGYVSRIDTGHGDNGEGRPEEGQPGGTLADERVPDGGVEGS